VTVLLVSAAALAVYVGGAIAVSLMVSNHDAASLAGGIAYFITVVVLAFIQVRRAIKRGETRGSAMRSAALALLILNAVLSPVGLLILVM